jgi:hypothetical protein
MEEKMVDITEEGAKEMEGMYRRTLSNPKAELPRLLDLLLALDGQPCTPGT